MPPHGHQQTLFMGTCVPKSGRKRWSLGGARQISCVLSPTAAFVFYPPFIPYSVILEGSGDSLSRAFVGSLYT